MSYIRCIRTTAERRAVLAAEEQGVRVRAARNMANLPDAWIDKPHARRGRNDKYKSHRRV